MPTAISIRNIVKSFGASSAGRANAVDEVSLEIGAGEMFFLLGPSGCGKTTLLRMIAGFIEPTAGTILFDGQDITTTPPSKRNTGMVFQSYALWPHMTVAENVAFGLKTRNVPATERDQRVREALHLVQMVEYTKQKPNQLSGGQQQRVALARAIVIRPSVLLLDEPLSNLDAKLRVELRTEIRRICKAAGMTTVYVTHDQHEALSIADRIAIMNQGRVVQVGAPTELYQRPSGRFVAEFLGEVNLLPGVVLKLNGDQGVARTAIGTVTCSSRAPLKNGDAVTCCIRPEFVDLAPSTSSGGAAARVVSVAYLGNEVRYAVQLADGTLLRAATHRPTAVRSEGDRVSIVLHAGVFAAV